MVSQQNMKKSGTVPEQKGVVSASRSELETVKNKPRTNVTAQRSLDLMDQREMGVIGKTKANRKLSGYRAMKTMMGLYVLSIAAFVYAGAAQKMPQNVYGPALVALTMCSALMGYGMRHEKKRLIADHAQQLRKQQWGSHPSDARVWAHLIRAAKNR